MQQKFHERGYTQTVTASDRLNITELTKPLLRLDFWQAKCCHPQLFINCFYYIFQGDASGVKITFSSSMFHRV